MNDFICRKILDRTRQYGFGTALFQILRALVRRVYQANLDIIFVIPGFSGREFHDKCIKSLTKERIGRAEECGELSHAEVQMLTGFLDEGSKGICAEIDGKLAGYAWVQYDGKYRFGRSGWMKIPPKYVVVKNLYVCPEFRGQKIGQKLNLARLALIPSDHIPVVCIIPENRFAIRNWEKYGFERVLEVRQSKWFRGLWQMRIKRLSSHAEAETLFQVFEKENRV